jgi:hypothetical protein
MDPAFYDEFDRQCPPEPTKDRPSSTGIHLLPLATDPGDESVLETREHRRRSPVPWQKKIVLPFVSTMQSVNRSNTYHREEESFEVVPGSEKTAEDY